MSDTRDTRTEQALAFGHSHGWILTHIGGTEDDIARAIERMDAAHRNDNAAYISAVLQPTSVEADETWHGTAAGRDRHRRRHERPCQPCSAAHSEYTGRKRRERHAKPAA